MSDNKLWNTSTARWLFIGLMAALLGGFLISGLLCGLVLLPNLEEIEVGAVVGLLVWLFLSSGVVVIALAGAFLFLRRARRMDTIAENVGLEGTALDISTYEYTGSIAGRQVRVRFYLGAQIFLFVRARTGMRLIIAPESVRSRIAESFSGRTFLHVNVEEAHDVVISGENEETTRAVSENPAVREHFRTLLADTQGREIRHLIIQPHAVGIRAFFLSVFLLPMERLTAGNLRRWLEGLVSFADTLERLPQTAESEEPRLLEEVWGEEARFEVVIRQVLLIVGLATFIVIGCGVLVAVGLMLLLMIGGI